MLVINAFLFLSLACYHIDDRLCIKGDINGLPKISKLIESCCRTKSS